jgi:hypothetical protein
MKNILSVGLPKKLPGKIFSQEKNLNEKKK